MLTKFQMGLTALLITFLSWGQARPPITPPSPQENRWIDSVLQTMTLQQKVGQLFMVPVYSNKDAAYRKSTLGILLKYQVGGVIFMQGNPANQVALANEIQEASQIPLLVGQDAEWGLSMRLKGTLSFPKNMTLGAIRNDSLIYELGGEMARQLRRTGVHVNFAPVMDINNNPKNPVINYRSFGENKYNVARKGIMLTHGLQDHGVLACAKHFPGHGDTDVDSHFDLPVIPHDKIRLDTLELYPFTKSIQAGIGACMVAHLYIPALDTTPNRAITLSPKVVTGLLREDLGFRGLIFTDALEMHGVTKYFPPGKAEIEAFKAGNDILLTSGNIQKAAIYLEDALKKGDLSTDELNEKVKRILLHKYRLGLFAATKLASKNVSEDVNAAEGKVLRKRLYEEAITLAKNDKNLLPLKDLSRMNIAYVQIGGTKGGTFGSTLRKYGEVRSFHLSRNFTSSQRNALMDKLKPFNVVIVGIMGMNYQASRNFGISKGIAGFSRDLTLKGKKTILSVFGSPYALKFFGRETAILVGYEEATESQEAVASAIFGGIAVSGRLPITASPRFKEGTGLKISKPIRFGFGYPEEEGFDSKSLERIDSLARHYINRKAMPGCAILVARGNRIVYQKGFGKTHPGSGGKDIHPYFHTYDLASVTKVCATTLSIMKMVESGILELDKPISTYLPDLKGTNKAKLTIRRLLQHNAGLPRWKPFYRNSFADRRMTTLRKDFYIRTRTKNHNIKLASNLYASPTLKDSVWKWIKAVEVKNSLRVNYSDIGMLILGRIIKTVSGTEIDPYATHSFYRPLGMNSTSFNPGLKGTGERCPPSGIDNYWRHCTLTGYVHDEAASILGGQAGNAGLFSNIYDLAKLMYMMKNKGTYGGKTYFKKETIEDYTKKQLSYNRKGLGWDKPEISGIDPGPVSPHASPATFGHTGFTGTCVWVDPTNDLIYIFLSNRTYPRSSNRLLLKENVRIQIMDQIYEAMFAYRKKHLLTASKHP